MSELVIPHPNMLIGVTLASIGAFVAGCVYKQPEVAIPGLAIGGIAIVDLLTNFVDLIDIRNDLEASNEQFNDDASNFNLDR